jgi:hypothetical protein
MRVLRERQDVDPDKGSRVLFFAILGTIVLLFAAFLVLKPRGPDAKAPSHSMAHP